MAFQNKCGTIVLDAVLTDIGRQKLARSNFKISKFSLGDDEVDYAFGNMDNGTWEIPPGSFPKILEAGSIGASNIKYGLLSLPRQDVTYFPSFVFNQKALGAALKSSVGDVYYVAVNDETTTKLKTAFSSNDSYIMENNQASRNFIFIESGITDTELSTVTTGPAGKERFITNLGLADEYVFMYCDGRFVDKLLINTNDAYFKDDTGDNLYIKMSPLVSTVKISLGSSIENFETYRAKTVNNEIFEYSSTNSAILGPRGVAIAFNIKVTDKLVGPSTASPDERYTAFGTTDSLLFGGGDKYDYIDTNILLEGASTGMQLLIPLRIVRYAGT